jgi:hypothetical protein
MLDSIWKKDNVLKTLKIFKFILRKKKKERKKEREKERKERKKEREKERKR